MINKYLLGLLCLVVLFYDCKSESQTKLKENKSDVDNSIIKLSKGILEFEEKIIDKGSVSEGEIVEAIYNFRNIGKEALTIEYVNPDCICTDFEFTKKPIEVNGKGFVKLSLDTKKKYGQQKLFATIKTNNLDKFYRVILKVNVILNEEKKN